MRVLLGIALIAGPVVGSAQLTRVADDRPQAVFAGTEPLIRVAFRNPTDKPVLADLRTRLFQTSSATAMPLSGPLPWKELQVLPGQTVVEFARLTIPAVKVATRFRVQWLVGPGETLGSTDVIAFPPGVLRELKTLARETPIGILDPHDIMKPALTAAGVAIEQVEGGDSFHGQLAILGPFLVPADMPVDLTRRVKRLIAFGTGVIWIRPPVETESGLEPPVRLIPGRDGRVLVAPTGLFSNLSDNPRAQLRLVELAATVLKPEPWELSLLTQ